MEYISRSPSKDKIRKELKMIKILRKYSRLLALALVFSSSLPFSSLAVEPQNPKFTTTQTQEEQQEDLTKKYDVSKLLGLFDFYVCAEEMRPRCGLPVLHNPCNKRVRYFYLLPDFSHNVIAIGKNCLENHFGHAAKEAAKTPENKKKFDIVVKIFSYFLFGNWYEKESTGSYVLELSPLLENPDLKGIIKCSDEYFTIFFQASPTKNNPHPYDMAYADTFANSCKAFKETHALADKKFAAFCYFCKENEIF